MERFDPTPKSRQALNFEPALRLALPETWALLAQANLTLHPAVERVILHGSRGPAGGFRPASDLDLSLLVDTPPGAEPASLVPLLDSVLHTTLSGPQAGWAGAVELDLAVIFDRRGCGLKCFDWQTWDDRACPPGGLDCFGLYKTQKGFSGLVTNAGIQVRRMYPCLKIWQRG